LYNLGVNGLSFVVLYAPVNRQRRSTKTVWVGVVVSCYEMSGE